MSDGQFAIDRTEPVFQQFISALKSGTLPSPKAGFQSLPLSHQSLMSLFDSGLKSRLLDIHARRLKEKGESFYTIGSSGHEGNAVIGQVFPITDMAFLHYRSGALFIERAKQHDDVDGVRDVLLSLVASVEDSISSGRHKVFGSVPLNIPPQTSTIASHLPKALGAAMAITRAHELGTETPSKKDSIVLCNFGDASFNHAASQTTFNATAWLRRQGYPVPLVFICEDNGIGISVPTPKDWVAMSMAERYGFHYIEADGLDLCDMIVKTQEAAKVARKKRAPVFLHMRCARLLGHAGSDIETQYSTHKQILAREANDPLLYSAAILIHHGLMSAEDIICYTDKMDEEISDLANQVIQTPKLDSASAVMDAIVPTKRLLPKAQVSEDQRKKTFAAKYGQTKLKRTLQQCINFALTDIMLQYPEVLLFGEDVGKKGGVYRVTADLQQQFGIRRVFDTLLDETTILGSAIGLAHHGFIPIPEIQFLAYLHNAVDQLRGEAATLSFFSNGQFQNPCVIRIASLAYQRGFGGHFHNDNAIAFLREIPGVIIACPSNGNSAAKLLRECVRLAYEERRVVIFLEPIALYMTKDLHDKDGGWLTHYPDPSERIDLGDVTKIGGGDTAIISYANGFYLANQAREALKESHQLEVTLIDLNWLSPLPMDNLTKALTGINRVVIVDECRKTGSLSEELITLLVESEMPTPEIKRVTGLDSFIPTGRSWQYVLPTRDDIITAVLALNGKE